MLHEYGQPRAADVFPARNSIIFEELESSESGPLWVPYSDSSRRASAPTPNICSQMGREVGTGHGAEVGLGAGVGTG